MIKDKAVVQAGWDDAPWLDQDQMASLLKNTPPHLQEARRYGTPTIGAGSIYQVPLDSILVDDFKIPNHYRRLYSIDVGWNCTAILHGAINPDDDCLYLYSEHKQGESRPEIHAHYAKGLGAWIPGVIDPASRGRSQVDGMSLFSMYRECGLNLSLAKNEVESGIAQTYQRLSAGKLKAFKSLRQFQKEYVTYARDLQGKIIKKDDHLMDCMKYLVLNINRAVPPPINVGNVGGKGARKYF